MATRQTITVGRLRFRVGPWHPDPTVAQVVIGSHGHRGSTEEIRQLLDRVVDAGYLGAITSALDANEVSSYLTVGFSEYDRLTVLRHDLSDLHHLPPVPDDLRIRRGRRTDRTRSLEVDGAAFPSFWRLDHWGLADAESATPTSRFRVAWSGDDLVGYAVTGRGGSQGFLQRLATRPTNQRRGVGTALVADSLTWCQRRRCTQAFVNTQVGNGAALALYERLGFHGTDHHLVVLRWSAP